MLMRFRFRKSCIALVMASSCMISSCAPFLLKDYRGNADSTPVRILIVRTSGEVEISSSAAMKLYRNGTLIKESQSGKSFKFTPATLHGVITAEPGGEPIMVNGQPYRGSMILSRQNESLLVVNVLPIDDYLISVVPGEIPANWEKESLKAQAVAARSFTYYHLKPDNDPNVLFDLDATSASQVYRGMTDEKPQTTEAVRKTSGQIMVYKEKPILSYFHSTCGGKTIDDRYVWAQSSLPYLQGVKCGFCEDSTKYSWDSTLQLAEIRENLLKKYPRIGGIRTISFRRKDDRVVEVVIRHSGGTIRMSGNNFRLLFPAEKMRSLYFTSKKDRDKLILKGHGWGHGVGLCQWGARGMAMRGYGYKDILRHYYLNIKITYVRNSYIASKHKNAYNCQ